MEIKEIIQNANGLLTGFEYEFFKRMWETDLNVYNERLKIIDFTNKGKVLDAGFGNGQWLVELSRLNSFVDGIEYSQSKTNAVKYITDSLGINNVNLKCGDITNLPYEDNYFDAVFCYGVIYLTDYKKALSEFYRVLKPGGKLYFTFAGLGWFSMIIITEHNKTENYDSRQIGIDAIANTLNYQFNGVFNEGMQLFTTRELLEKDVKETGFKDIAINTEGHINLVDGTAKSFYKYTSYANHDFIYEVLCEK